MLFIISTSAVIHLIKVLLTLLPCPDCPSLSVSSRMWNAVHIQLLNRSWIVWFCPLKHFDKSKCFQSKPCLVNMIHKVQNPLPMIRAVLSPTRPLTPPPKISSFLFLPTSVLAVFFTWKALQCLDYRAHVDQLLSPRERFSPLKLPR